MLQSTSESAAEALHSTPTMRLPGACVYILVVVAAGFCTTLPATAQTFSTFDDFSVSRIDGVRWSGFAHTVRFRARTDADPNSWNNQSENPLLRHPQFSTSNASALRRIVSGHLQLQLDSVGGTHPNPDVVPGYGRLGLSSRGWARHSAVRATVTPMVADAPACRTDGESRVRASLSVSILGSVETVDAAVFARLVLERSSFGGDRIYAVLSRCRQDWGCAVAEDLDRVDFNRTWLLRRASTLTIRHQPATGRVTFVVAGGGGRSESHVLRAPLADDTAVITGFGLRVDTGPANCPSSAGAPAERVEVTIDARFDDVQVAGP
jgi:hypothetical protein